MHIRRDQRGQAAAELVAVLPIAFLCALALAQLALVGYAQWSAGDAARAGARALHVGDSARRAALRAAPEALRPEVEVGEGEVEVRVFAPALVPGLPAITLRAASQLDPEAGR